ncbi:MAG: hypothetical protein HUK24_06205 [Sphaerochaetaceae bacterium]|nr:hypothetical protein [Sphaerochaetaceae bacterium]
MNDWIVKCSQTYVGGMRQILHRLNICATQHNCAIVLVGRLNKITSSKTLYRGLGTIDVVAVARSVLQVEHCKENENIRQVTQLKNSISPLGDNIFFKINDLGNLEWLNNTAVYQEDLSHQKTKKNSAVLILKSLLSNGPVEANKVYAKCKTEKIGTRTLCTVKKYLDIKSFRKDGQWYWALPNSKTNNAQEGKNA